MDTEQAAEHLQTIRTLMERSALYRRALAPISTFTGIVGIAAAIVGWRFKIPAAGPFALYWMAIALVSLSGALIIVRRQAVKQGEDFWSPPTRRVAQAMMPALLIGLAAGLWVVATDWLERSGNLELLLLVWTVLYGLALHAAGFFVNRGMRLFGLGFLVMGIGLVILLPSVPEYLSSPHLLMGIVFGLSHLAYGIYLYFTERKNEV